MSTPTLRLGTRNSLLALAQTDFASTTLTLECGVKCERVEVTTAADTKLSEVPLSQIGGQGVFTKELEHALLDGRCDVAVHSLKDVPTLEPAGLCLAAVLPREDPRDTIVTNLPGITRIADLPQNCRVGTSSLRRKAQLLALRPDLVVLDVRGNLQTRLRKLDEGQFDALVLAAAGLRRLNLDNRIACFIDSAEMMHAVGQGAIALQIRASDEATAQLVKKVNCQPTWQRIVAERALLRELEGGCRVPIGVHSEWQHGRIVLTARVVAADGTKVVEARREGENAEQIGTELGKELRTMGAMEILRAAGREDKA